MSAWLNGDTDPMQGKLQIRIHGRGGQGVVTSAEVLSIAAFHQGVEAQAFPSFGSERMGAPVMAFCKMSDSVIRSREPVSEPDVLIIQDPTLLHQVELFTGFDPEKGTLIVNAAESAESLGLAEMAEKLGKKRFTCLNASRIGQETLGRPMPNAALLGAFAALTGSLGVESISKAFLERFPGPVGEMNGKAAQAGFEAASGRSG